MWYISWIYLFFEYLSLFKINWLVHTRTKNCFEKTCLYAKKNYTEKKSILNFYSCAIRKLRTSKKVLTHIHFKCLSEPFHALKYEILGLNSELDKSFSLYCISNYGLILTTCLKTSNITGADKTGYCRKLKKLKTVMIIYLVTLPYFFLFFHLIYHLEYLHMS